MTEAGIGRPKALSGLGLIVRRELLVYFGSVGGYVIASLMLAILGLLFNTRAVGGGSKYSVEVLTEFFNSVGGLVLVASCFIAMRLIAEERQAGTLALLQSSALTEGEVVLAKFLSAWLFLGAIMVVSVYMPALIFLHGKVSVGHIFAGYLGTCLLGGAVIAIGTFGSAVAKTQVVAVVIGGALTTVMTLSWLLARIVEGSLGDVLGYVALWDKQFTPFMRGTISLSGVLYYVSITAFFLVLARNALESRRWSS